MPWNVYKYTKLKDIAIGNIVNIFANIKYVDGPKKSPTDLWYMTLGLTDESLIEKENEETVIFYCILFEESVERLPYRIIEGDIIRLNQIRIVKYMDTLQGKKAFGFSWLFYREGHIESPSQMTLCTEWDEERFQFLLDWTKSKQEIDFKHQDVLSNETQGCQEKIADLIAELNKVLEPHDWSDVKMIVNGEKKSEHSSKSFTTLDEVVFALDYPKKFTCKSHISDVFPRNIMDGIQASCKCENGISIRHEQTSHIRDYKCINCDCSFDFYYKDFTLTLEDHLGMLDVILKAEDVKCFFYGIPALNVCRLKKCQELVQKSINFMTSSFPQESTHSSFVVSYDVQSYCEGKSQEISYRVSNIKLPEHLKIFINSLL